MKILFVGDASNFHNTLSHAFKDMGHSCVVVSNGSKWQKTDRDINLSRNPGTFGTVKYCLDIIATLPKMRGYDIVHLVNPHFLELRPDRIKKVYSYLKKHNGKVFLSALGTDLQYIRACKDGKTFRYSDYMLGDKPSPYMLSPESAKQDEWFNPECVNYNNFFLDSIDGAVACLYEYYMSYKDIIPHKLGYAGIPIDTQSLQPHFIDNAPHKVRFFIGIQKARTILKGTDLLLDAATRLQAKYPHECEVVIAENVPYKEYVEMMNSSHVMLDQVYSYTPATNALIAMAQGMIAVSGAEPEYYDFIGEHTNRPIINVNPLAEDDIYRQLEWILKNKQELPRLSRMSRDFVITHNDSHIVAQRHLDFWNKISSR